MGNPPFEGVSPIRIGGFPASYVSIPKGIPKESRLENFQLPSFVPEKPLARNPPTWTLRSLGKDQHQHG